MRAAPLLALRHLAYSLTGALLILIPACAPRLDFEESEDLQRDVAILEPAVPTQTSATSLTILRQILPEARSVQFAHLEEAMAACLRDNMVLLVPEAAHIPVDAWNPLGSFLETGGALALWGADPFSARVAKVDGAYRTEDDYFRTLSEGARDLPALQSIQIWDHLNDPAAASGRIRIARERDLPWTAVNVEVKDLQKSDMLGVQVDPAANLGISENSIVLYARGDANTASVVVELTQNDGTEWFHVLHVSEKWQLYVLHERKFEPYPRNPSLEEKGHLDLSRLSSVKVGLNTDLAPERGGPHTFGVSEIRFASDARDAETIFGWPSWGLAAKPERHYSFSGSQLLDGTGKTLAPVRGKEMQSPLPGPRGIGRKRLVSSRWIPLFSVDDEEGRTCGWPASLFVDEAGESGATAWGWVATPPSRDLASISRDMIYSCIRRLRSRHFLLRAGCTGFSFSPQENISVDVTTVSRGTGEQNMRLSAYLMDGDHIVRRAVTSLAAAKEPTRVTTSLMLGAAPPAGAETSNYTVRVSLETSSDDEVNLDVIEQPIKVYGPRLVKEQERLATSDRGFRLAGQPSFLLGTRYRPPGSRFTAEHAPDSTWLDRDVFDPELIKLDLARLKTIRANTLWVDYEDARQGPQLRFFVEEAWIRGMGVIVRMPHLDPLRYDPVKASRLLRALPFDRTPGLQGIEIATASDYGNSELRADLGLDAAWQQWLVEQYGNIEHAETVIGPLTRSRKNLAGPTDAALRTGTAREAVAYRAFLSDWTSRRYGAAIRFLRQQGVSQLIGIGCDYGTSSDPFGKAMLPMDIASGLAHADFACVHMYEQSHAAGFLTAYARGMSGGKPVVWMSQGRWPHLTPSASETAWHSQAIQNVISASTNSYAAGVILSSYAGFFESPFNTDLGLTCPCGSLRPAANTIRRFAHDLRNRRHTTPATKERTTYDRYCRADGLTGLWRDWTKGNHSGSASIVPATSGTVSSQLIPKGLCGEALNPPAPIQGLNAEWGNIHMPDGDVRSGPHVGIERGRDEALKIEIINTGVGSWVQAQPGLKQSVWIRASREGRRALLIQLPHLSSGEGTTLEWTPRESGVWALRAHLLDVGDFGESLAVEVK